jgi:hypothetical protein
MFLTVAKIAGYLSGTRRTGPRQIGLVLFVSPDVVVNQLFSARGTQPASFASLVFTAQTDNLEKAAEAVSVLPRKTATERPPLRPPQLPLSMKQNAFDDSGGASNWRA